MNKIAYGIGALFISVLAWIWTTTYSKLVEIEKSLCEVKIEMVRIQASILTEEKIIKIVRTEMNELR